MNELRKVARHTRAHRAGGVAGGAMLGSVAGVLHRVRYSINATLSISSDPSGSLFGLACGLFSARWVLEALGKEDLGLYGVVGALMICISFLNAMLSGISIGSDPSGSAPYVYPSKRQDIGNPDGYYAALTAFKGVE